MLLEALHAQYLADSFKQWISYLVAIERI